MIVILTVKDCKKCHSKKTIVSLIYTVNNCKRSDLCFQESSLRVNTHRLCLEPHPKPSFTSPYISSLYSPQDRVIENKSINSDTGEHLLLTNTITEGKNKKQNYKSYTALKAG